LQGNGSIGKVSYYHLMILDINSGKITDTCLEQKDFQPGNPRLIWSPNGDQLAAAVNDRPSNNTWDVIVADLEQKYAVKLAEGLYPIGWLVTVP
jgi:hypothetical protein